MEKIRQIETSYGLSGNEQACLRAAAYLLVRDRSTDLREAFGLPHGKLPIERSKLFEKHRDLCLKPTP